MSSNSCSDSSRKSIVGKHLDEVSSSLLEIESTDDDKNVFVKCRRDISRGEHILSVPSVAIGLDTAFRKTHCGFCAKALRHNHADHTHTKDDNDSFFCPKCCVVSICDACQKAGVDVWHQKSGECLALSCLVQSHASLFIDPDQQEYDDYDTNVTKKAESVDSTYIITVRLMLRRWFEEKQSCQPNSTKTSMHQIFPPVNWDVFSKLYSTEITDSNEREHYDTAVTALCRLMRQTYCKRQGKDDGVFISKENFDDILGKVMGCCHAITDVTLQLGCQCFGKALFIEHSFYNHSCAPNAFLSCQFEHESTISCTRKASSCKEHNCALVARIFSIKDIHEKDSITLSYIPTCGIDRIERQERLKRDYNFVCKCLACSTNSQEEKSISYKWQKALQVPTDGDVNALREVQFNCNQCLLDCQKQYSQSCDMKDKKTCDDEYSSLDQCIVMIRMSMNGIKNQGIGPSHETSIEAHRLLAAALSLSGKLDLAIKEYQYLLCAVEPIHALFDPVALATIKLDYCVDLKKVGNLSQYELQLKSAHELVSLSVGHDHKFSRSIQKQLDDIDDCENNPRKKQKSAT